MSKYEICHLEEHYAIDVSLTALKKDKYVKYQISQYQKKKVQIRKSGWMFCSDFEKKACMTIKWGICSQSI